MSKVSTSGDRFSITVHRRTDRSLLGKTRHSFRLEVKDAQAAEEAREFQTSQSRSMYPMPLEAAGIQVVKHFDTDDPGPVVDVLRAAADLLEQEAAR